MRTHVKHFYTRDIYLPIDNIQKVLPTPDFVSGSNEHIQDTNYLNLEAGHVRQRYSL